MCEVRMAARKKPVYGVGINDMTTPVKEKVNGVIKSKKFYSVWMGILTRSYCPKFKTRNPSYAGVEVCDEWKFLSNFKIWFDYNYKDGYDLDKDIIVGGNKIYSPSTCIFIPHEINTFILESNRKRGDCMIGVCKQKTKSGNIKFVAQIADSGRSHYVGQFDTEIEAHVAWKKAKLEKLNILIDKYPDMDIMVVNSLITRYTH